jgi:hypothetical protein
LLAAAAAVTFRSLPPPLTRHLCGRHAAGRLILAKRDGGGSDAVCLAAVGAATAAKDDAGRGVDGGMVNGSMLALVVVVVVVLLLSLLETGEMLRLAAALGAPALEDGFRFR